MGEHMPTSKNEARAWLDQQEATDRKNGRVIDKVMVALPKELTSRQQAAQFFLERVAPVAGAMLKERAAKDFLSHAQEAGKAIREREALRLAQERQRELERAQRAEKQQQERNRGPTRGPSRGGGMALAFWRRLPPCSSLAGTSAPAIAEPAQPIGWSLPRTTAFTASSALESRNIRL